VPRIERKLQERGWSHGPRQIGSVRFTFTPLSPSHQLAASSWPNLASPGRVARIDVTTVVAQDLRGPLKAALAAELALVFPGVPVSFPVSEDSRHPARLYALLVAHTSAGTRLGRDWLYDKSTRGRAAAELATEVARRVVDDLDNEVRRGGCVDEYLQDQLVVFQALAQGRSSVVSESLLGEAEDSDPGVRADRDEQPFGTGSMHTQTARWVVGQLLPGVKWRDGGRVCEGVGWNATPASLDDGLADLSLDSGK
jgi:RNA 3'-terminal phosphate cyclase (ATP)